jgi:hypothetical protein
MTPIGSPLLLYSSSPNNSCANGSGTSRRRSSSRLGARSELLAPRRQVESLMLVLLLVNPKSQRVTLPKSQRVTLCLRASCRAPTLTWTPAAIAPLLTYLRPHLRSTRLHRLACQLMELGGSRLPPVGSHSRLTSPRIESVTSLHRMSQLVSRYTQAGPRSVRRCG